MPVTYVIRFEVLEQGRERFLELLTGVLDSMRSEPMFHEATLHRDPDSELRFMLYETWHDHEDVLEVQLKRPYRQAFHEALSEVLAKPRDVSIWCRVRRDCAAGSQRYWPEQTGQ